MSAWWNAFPTLKDIQDPKWRALMANVRTLTIPPATAVFHAGATCRSFLFVLEGSVRVEKTAGNGREIVLYRVARGETCLLTTSCLIAKQRYPAEGVTETEVLAAALPENIFHEALTISPEFRAFVFASFGARMTDLILLVGEVTFGHADMRLARWLLESGSAPDEIVTTLQPLAAELGTAREVISRLLKDFERRGLVQLARGRIVITNRPGLETLAAAAV
ncbi:MAG: Crp/Fnr family transcriptional regulator [Sulfuricaulis sp.]